MFVPGVPRPQGSKDPYARPGGGVNLVESARGLKAWRRAIVEACQDNEGAPRAVFARGVPVRLECVFVMPRTSRHPKTPGRPTPPHTVKPDGDKLLRAVCDALTMAGVVWDDGQIDDHGVRKRYALIGEPTGVHITVHTSIEEDP